MSSYLEYYNTNIKALLEKIDVYFRSEDSENITPDIVSELLDIEYNEVLSICRKNNINKISNDDFIHIMFHGSSNLCLHFKRLISRNIKDSYKPEDISYIYNIPIEIVNAAMSLMKIDKIKATEVKKLFSIIYVNQTT